MDCACFCNPCYANTTCVPITICPAQPQHCPCDTLPVPCVPVPAVFKPVVRPAYPVSVCPFPPRTPEAPRGPCRPPELPCHPCGECVIIKRRPIRPPALAPGGYCCPPFKTTTGPAYRTPV
ncbi:unnamed protein product [Phyllotreta striolata]|uniref:Uncharacterized protein n=1 Tax=Phyllotreta striolata TaxID=444603 RepID=A0A9N9TTF8_PHYSR|nr:unnamed protein product [Phyllotreta striolata]